MVPPCPFGPTAGEITFQPDGADRCTGAGSTQYRFQRVCLPLPAGKDCGSFSPLCAAPLYNCGLETLANYVCGPLPPEFGACCYVVAGGCPVGRPFIVDAHARVASIVQLPGYGLAADPAVEALDTRDRMALAHAYAREGLAEHASVASFARFTLHCLALGAPPDLVADSVRAGLEELAHARRCFGLASAYAGMPLGPGALEVQGALDEPVDAASVAASVAREGCVAETVSALLLAAARDAAQDPAVKAELSAMVEEEFRHALLAWRFVRWALERWGAPVRLAVAAVFRHAADHVGFGARSTEDASVAVLRAHGRLPVDERRAIARAALDEVVAEAARELLGDASSMTLPSCVDGSRACSPGQPR
jgi:hypothetical protein